MISQQTSKDGERCIKAEKWWKEITKETQRIEIKEKSEIRKNNA